MAWRHVEICLLMTILFPVLLTTTQFFMDKNLQWAEAKSKMRDERRVANEESMNDVPEQLVTSQYVLTPLDNDSGVLMSAQLDTDLVRKEKIRRKRSEHDSNSTKCGEGAGFSYTFLNDSLLVDFKAPCCAIDCEYRLSLKTWWSDEMRLRIEFQDMNIPSPLSIDSLGFQSCKDSFLKISPLVYGTFCGNTIPKPLEIVGINKELVMYSKTNTLCRDFNSFRLIVRPKGTKDRCFSQHSVVQEGKSGFITAPGHSENEAYLFGEFCQWIIEVANDRVLQISFEEFQLFFTNTLSIYTDTVESLGIEALALSMGSHTTRHRYKKGYYVTLPVNKATVVYYALDGLDRTFKLHYEAVSREAYIPIVVDWDDYYFNCTGHEHSLPQYSICNYFPECIEREDERNCSYRDTTTCPGGIVFESSCYIIKPLREIQATWNLAEEICKEQYGGHLMTINTHEEFQFISDIIDAYYLYSVFLGMLQMSYDDDPLYRRLHRGVDDVIIFGGLWHQFSPSIAPCTALKENSGPFNLQVESIRCQDDVDVDTQIICEAKTTVQTKRPLIVSTEVVWTEKTATSKCSETLERISLSRQCDGNADCFDGTDEIGCADKIDTSNYFFCKSGALLWFSHVCDGISDCEDKSDEEFCLSVPDDDPDLAVCADGTPVPSASWCDGKPDCLDGSDELDCLSCQGVAILCPSLGCIPREWADDDALDCPIQDQNGLWIIEPEFVSRTILFAPPPGVVMPDGYGKVTIQPLNESDPCPPTHAQCPRGYCIPIYMLCNGYKDCPEGEDELPETCETSCKGRFKCHQTSICLHDDQICDGWYHCPFHDDETLCPGNNNICPLSCACSGREMTCHANFPLHNAGCIKLLDISHTTAQNYSLTIMNHCLIALIARNSGIRELGELNMVNLYKLDLSDNQIGHLPVGVFDTTSNIHDLSLARNKFADGDLQQLTSLKNLEELDISGNSYARLKSNAFACCSKLKALYLDDMGITIVESKAFHKLTELQLLSIRGNPISVFEPNIFSDLIQLSTVYSDNYKLCCSVILPQSLSRGTCQAPKDEISSCEDILPSPFYRTFLWLMAVLTIVGNSAVLVYKFCIDRTQSKLGYHTFITSLSVSDLFMGIYLAIIGGADQMFQGRYLWEEEAWKSSSYCSLAGFICMTSSEVSAMTICLITLDRFIALAFPLSTVRLTPNRARVAVLVSWMFGALLACIPLLPPLSHWQFYSQNGVCIPLPITRASFPGSDYAFSIFILFNCALFVSIAVGQVLILHSVRASSLKFKGTQADRRHQDSAIAQKLALVVITDFFCWFPIGIMGLLARVAVPIPGEANVVSTIFILPLNSAINPLLYTLPAVKQKFNQLNAKARSQKRREQSFVSESTDVGSRSERVQYARSGHQSSRNAVASSHGGQSVKTGAKTGLCLKKLQIWLRTGRISTDTVMIILAGFRGNGSDF